MVASPVMPNSFFSCCSVWASSALRSSALEGMHPTFRHTPPQYCFSITATSGRAARRGWRPRSHRARTEDDDIEITHAREPIRSRHASATLVRMRFLIAGSSGFLGTQLRQRLQALGHDVTSLVRGEAGAGQVRWDPYAGQLDPAVVESADVVVNLAGSPLVGNPHSKKWADELLHSRVVTTRSSPRRSRPRERPAFLAGNGISFYGDHGDQVLTEDADSRAMPCSPGVTSVAVGRRPGRRGRRAGLLPAHLPCLRPPQPAARHAPAAVQGGPRRSAGRRAPVRPDDLDPRLGRRGGAPRPARRRVGPVQPVQRGDPDQPGVHRELAHQLHRPAVVRAPAFAIRPLGGRAGRAGPRLGQRPPRRSPGLRLLVRRPDVAAVLREGLSPSR